MTDPGVGVIVTIVALICTIILVSFQRWVVRRTQSQAVRELAQLRGEDFSQLHIVGGGCQNTLLNQLCADACGIRVIAGPVEASTLGNIGIQLMTLDELNNVDDFRQVVSTTANLTTFTPNPDSEIAHYVAQIHSTRQTKELCA